MKISRLYRTKRARLYTLLAACLLLLLALLAFPFYLAIPEKLSQPLHTRAITARDGTWLGSVPLADHYRQEPLPANEPIPELIKRALLISEDKRFYNHVGIDFLALGRAIRDNASAARVRSGASTLSMQLAKMLRPAGERTILAKIKETLLARRLEMSYSKEELLRAYLNHADFGQLCRGIETASRYYFNKAASELEVHESALLIAQLRSPTRYNPWRHPARALEARNRILRLLAEPAQVLERPLDLKPLTHRVPAHLSKKAGQLTISALLQEHVQAVVREEVSGLSKHNLRQAAVIVVDNSTGEILASVPSADRSDPAGGQMDGTRTPRSAGSTLKPFVYLLALREGKHPASIYADLPTPFPDASGINAPSNYNDNFLGPISMRTALASSQNIPALLTLNEHGLAPALLTLLEQLGYDIPPDDYGLGLAIGNAHVTLLEQAEAFCTLARGGLAIPLTLYLDAEASSLPVGKRLIEPSHAYQISSMLSDASARIPGFGAARNLRFTFPCAVKTGTSSNFRDNWCIGYTPRYTVAVWAGNFDQSRMDKVSGLMGAAPIFHRVMSFLHEYEPSGSFGDPQALGLRPVKLDPRTGRLATQKQQSITEWLTQPQLSSIQPLDDSYDAQGRCLLPIEYRAWYRAQGEHVRAEYAIDTNRQLGRAPRIHMPADGTSVHLDDTLRHGGRLIPLRSNLHADRALWHCDSLRVYKRGEEWYAELSEGRHRIEVLDPETEQRAHSVIHVTR